MLGQTLDLGESPEEMKVQIVQNKAEPGTHLKMKERTREKQLSW